MNVVQEPEGLHVASIRRAGLALVVGVLACLFLAAFLLHGRCGTLAPPGFVGSRGALEEAERSGIELSIFPTESGQGERQLGKNPLTLSNRPARPPLVPIRQAIDDYLSGQRARRETAGAIDYAALEPRTAP